MVEKRGDNRGSGTATRPCLWCWLTNYFFVILTKRSKPTKSYFCYKTVFVEHIWALYDCFWSCSFWVEHCIVQFQLLSPYWSKWDEHNNTTHGILEQHNRELQDDVSFEAKSMNLHGLGSHYKNDNRIIVKNIFIYLLISYFRIQTCFVQQGNLHEWTQT